MDKLLLDESAQTYQPALAAWVGLNEAIFLQQLHYILTQNSSVGRFADGRKWYRDQPRAFMVKYFPFWDENTVKRTIANLRADALILARSDLNTKAKDRSLWYTVNYPALENLTGPVARITEKSAKRKEARSARKTEADEVPGRYSNVDYTKVQNVLMTNGAKVQNVPISKVQNVPTPKDSLPKDSKELTPKGVVGQPTPGAKMIIRDKFLELTGLTMPTSKSNSGFWWSNFGEILKLARGDPALACKWEFEAVSYMQASHLTITGPKSIVGLIGALASGQTLQKGQSTNGTYKKPTEQSPDRASLRTPESIAAQLAAQANPPNRG